MSTAREFLLSQEAWSEIARHSEESFPEECCGLILSIGAKEQVRRVENIQNKLHVLDPATYPRTAAIAYAMDPKELQAVLDAAEAAGGKLKAFYHSHPDHEAYFSAEDKAFATAFGEPTFPKAVQIVVSVIQRTVRTIKAFGWSDEMKDFIELPIRRI
jgi:proteasome lid subunit RPN8/RPN11